MPLPEHLATLVEAEMQRIERDGVLVPQEGGQNGTGGLERIKGPVPVGRVQRFWPTAPPEGQPGGSACKSIFIFQISQYGTLGDQEIGHETDEKRHGIPILKRSRFVVCSRLRTRSIPRQRNRNIV
jgi:hypothetical protein